MKYSAGITKNIIFSTVLLLLLLAFMHIAHEVIVEQEVNFDQRVENWIAAHRTVSLTRFFSLITYAGSSYFLLPAYILVIGYLFFKNRQRAWFLLLIGSISFISLVIVKLFYKRVRPSYYIAKAAGGYSFPSGHTMSTCVFFGLMIYLIAVDNKMAAAWKIGLIVLLSIICVLVGISRLYLGVHFASDVLAGYCLGAFFLFIAYKLMSKHAPAIKK